jgi:predicted TIM-barrel fold metal-dependent hydrolase
MIIDAHCHVHDEKWCPRWFWEMLTTIRSRRQRISPAEAKKGLREAWDPSGDTMVRCMDNAKVDKAVICVTDFGLFESREDAPLPIEEINRRSCAMVKRHPGRLYLGIGVDPRRRNALEIIETGVKEWGAKSLKLHPATGWYPDDRKFYPLYEKCGELGLPVNFHTGPWFLRSNFCDPMRLADVAFDFPDLTIYCTHSGDLLFMEMVGLAKMYRNMVLDLAGWQRWLKGSHYTALKLYQTARFIMDMVGPRLMFASDWVGNPEDADYCSWVKAFTEIPAWVKEAGVEFSAKELEGYLSQTALSSLRLS